MEQILTYQMDDQHCRTQRGPEIREQFGVVCRHAMIDMRAKSPLAREGLGPEVVETRGSIQRRAASETVRAKVHRLRAEDLAEAADLRMLVEHPPQHDAAASRQGLDDEVWRAGLLRGWAGLRVRLSGHDCLRLQEHQKPAGRITAIDRWSIARWRVEMTRNGSGPSGPRTDTSTHVRGEGLRP